MQSYRHRYEAVQPACCPGFQTAEATGAVPCWCTGLDNAVEWVRSVRLNTCELRESSSLEDVGWTVRIGSHYPSCCPGDLLQSANVTFLCVAEETDQSEENGILYHGLVE